MNQTLTRSPLPTRKPEVRILSPRPLLSLEPSLQQPRFEPSDQSVIDPFPSMGIGSELLGKLRRNAQSLFESHTVGEAVTRWLEEIERRRDLRKGSQTAYRNAARAIIEHAGTVELTRWTASDTDRLVDTVGAGSWGRKVLWALRSVCERARQWGWATPDADALRCRLPQEDIREVHLSEQEAVAVTSRCLHLLDHMQWGSNRFGVAAIYILISTGARVSEVTYAKREEVRLTDDHGSIRVPASRSKNRRVRVLPLSGHAAGVVARLLGEHSSEWLLPSGRVAGRPIGRVTVSRQWRQMCGDLGLSPKYRVHDLRHTYASLAAQSGVSLYHLQEALGHLEPRSTRRYAHLQIEQSVAVSEVVARRIGGAK